MLRWGSQIHRQPPPSLVGGGLTFFCNSEPFFLVRAPCPSKGTVPLIGAGPHGKIGDRAYR